LEAIKTKSQKGGEYFIIRNFIIFYSSLVGPSVQGGWGHDMGAVVHGKDEKGIQSFSLETEGKKKRGLWQHSRTWEENMKGNLGEMGR